MELTAVQDISQADNLEVRDEVRQVKDVYKRQEYVLVITHALSVPVVKQLVIE